LKSFFFFLNKNWFNLVKNRNLISYYEDAKIAKKNHDTSKSLRIANEI
jgi:hypothetical protein